MKNSISLDELKTHMHDKEAHIRYLLRIGAFKSMAAMARDLGVTDGYIRQIKHRKIHTRSYKVSRPNYVKGVLQLWGFVGVPI
jgi:hypothetical protein